MAGFRLLKKATTTTNVERNLKFGIAAGRDTSHILLTYQSAFLAHSPSEVIF